MSLRDYCKNVRVGAVIIKDNKILFHKNNNTSRFYTKFTILIIIK